MANLKMEDIIQMAENAASKLAESAVKLANQSVVLAKKASDKAATAGKLAVISANIGLEKQKLTDKAREMGMKYLEEKGEAPEEVFAAEVEEMRSIQAAIDALQKEADALKNPPEKNPPRQEKTEQANHPEDADANAA